MTVPEILESQFRLNAVEVKLLNGYDNKNYLVKNEHEKFVFKTYLRPNQLYEIVEAENQMLLHLKSKKFKEIPKPIAFSNGEYLQVYEIDGEAQLCRLLSFVDGEFMADLTPNERTITSLGAYAAALNKALFDFDHVALRARNWEWDLKDVFLNTKYISDIDSPQRRNWVRYFFEQYHENVVPALTQLRKSAIHNDLNEWNVLTKGGEVCGIIDFGDCAHSHLINEVAVMATYVFYVCDNPLHWAIPLLRSYHKILPLEEKEIDLLYYLIAMRLCMSVCNSAHASKSDPDNEYALISQQKAWRMLGKWLRIGPKKATNTFREAIGKPPLPISHLETHLSKRKKYISDILSISYRRPIAMERSAFQFMYDSQGNTFLDAYNNIPHVGHSHPRVVEAGRTQMAKLNTNTRYLYPLLHEYAEKLLAKFPKPLSKVFFVNSGSAASDLALRLARAHTGVQNLMVMEHGYHGNTQQGIEISDYKFSNPKGQGQQSHIYKTKLPDTYRGEHTQNNGTAGKAYAEEAIQYMSLLPNPLAAFISEPVVGCGGQVPLAKGYLKPVYDAIRAQGGVCISDEVQTGFGRLGEPFWGFEQQDVVPDIVVLGKPMGNGHPIGAVITTDEIAQSFEKGVEFFSSFGGNPVSCAVGLAVLDVIEEEELQRNALVVGNHYRTLLTELKAQYTCIGDVRGSGLFIGIDIVKPGSKEPDTKLAQRLKNMLRDNYILVSTDGPADNVIKSKPPMCFSKENAEEVVSHIKEILAGCPI